MFDIRSRYFIGSCQTDTIIANLVICEKTSPWMVLEAYPRHSKFMTFFRSWWASLQSWPQGSIKDIQPVFGYVDSYVVRVVIHHGVP